MQSTENQGCEEHLEEHLYGQWEHARLNIQQLSAALSMETNELLKQDML